MIKVVIKDKNITISGHANYDDYGKDIVCAAVSSIAITTVNNIISLDDSVDYEENSGLLIIRVKNDTERISHYKRGRRFYKKRM